MTTVRMARSELRRITSRPLTKAAVLALVLVPALYGGLYLYANHDPYRNLKFVPAAVVVEDTGARDADGHDVNAGRDVADELVVSAAFDWHQASKTEAMRGVEQGRYDFALTIPRDFSSALTNSATFDPEQAQLRLTTNDASSYVSATIANQVTETVRDALAQRLGTEAASNFLLGISETRSGLLEATQGATSLLEGVDQAKTGAGKLSDSADQVATDATSLEKSLGTVVDKAKPLPDQLKELATSARKVADDNKKAAKVGSSISAYADASQQAFNELRGKLRAQLVTEGLSDQQIAHVLSSYDATKADIRASNKRIHDATTDLAGLAEGAGKVANGNENFATSLPKLLDAIDKAHKGSGDLADGATTLGKGAGQLDGGLSDVATGGTALRDKLQAGADRIPVMDAKTRDKIAQTIGSPVRVESMSQAHATTYGAGLAPYFLPLAAWIGGYALLLLLRPLSSRAVAANERPLRVAVGGWLPAALIGAVQVAILSTAVLLAIGIEPLHVGQTLGFMLLASASFIAIMHCLNAWFGRAGQFLGLVLLVLQLFTTGGTFPWQTLPQPLHWLHAALPMSYAVTGLRQLMYGAPTDRVWVAVAVLAGYLVVALLLTSAAARRHRMWSLQRLRPELAI